MAIIVGTSGDDRIVGTAEDGRISGGAGYDVLYGGCDALFVGSGNDTIDGGAKSDALYGGAGIDTLDYSMLENGDSGVSVHHATNTGSNGDMVDGFEKVIGTSRADNLTGDTGSNVLDGQAADDRLVGAAGKDTLCGGTGNDTILGDDGDDLRNGGAGAASLDSGSGSDAADYTGSSAAVSVNLATRLCSGGDAAGDTLSGIENLIGSGIFAGRAMLASSQLQLHGQIPSSISGGQPRAGVRPDQNLTIARPRAWGEPLLMSQKEITWQF
jgi:Ca2+-binding RTX toxin-like protein